MLLRKSYTDISYSADGFDWHRTTQKGKKD